VKYTIYITDPNTSNPKQISGTIEELNWFADVQNPAMKAARKRKEWTLKAIDLIERNIESELWSIALEGGAA
jgi:hypothetical protein